MKIFAGSANIFRLSFLALFLLLIAHMIIPDPRTKRPMKNSTRSELSFDFRETAAWSDDLLPLDFALIKILKGFVEIVLYVLVFRLKKEKDTAGIV